MSAILNIGLKRNDGRGTIEAHDVSCDLAAFQLAPVDLGLAMSDTEATLIVSVCRWPTDTMVEFLCNKYAQDCIAGYSPRFAHGALMGPKAAERGPFNPELFVLDKQGRSLSDGVNSLGIRILKEAP